MEPTYDYVGITDPTQIISLPTERKLIYSGGRTDRALALAISHGKVYALSVEGRQLVANVIHELDRSATYVQAALSPDGDFLALLTSKLDRRVEVLRVDRKVTRLTSSAQIAQRPLCIGWRGWELLVGLDAGGILVGDVLNSGRTLELRPTAPCDAPVDAVAGADSAIVYVNDTVVNTYVYGGSAPEPFSLPSPDRRLGSLAGGEYYAALAGGNAGLYLASPRGHTSVPLRELCGGTLVARASVATVAVAGPWVLVAGPGIGVAVVEQETGLCTARFELSGVNWLGLTTDGQLHAWVDGGVHVVAVGRASWTPMQRPSLAEEAAQAPSTLVSTVAISGLTDEESRQRAVDLRIRRSRAWTDSLARAELERQNLDSELANLPSRDPHPVVASGAGSRDRITRMLAHNLDGFMSITVNEKGLRRVIFSTSEHRAQFIEPRNVVLGAVAAGVAATVSCAGIADDGKAVRPVLSVNTRGKTASTNIMSGDVTCLACSPDLVALTTSENRLLVLSPTAHLTDTLPLPGTPVCVAADGTKIVVVTEAPVRMMRYRLAYTIYDADSTAVLEQGDLPDLGEGKLYTDDGAVATAATLCWLRFRQGFVSVASTAGRLYVLSGEHKWTEVYSDDGFFDWAEGAPDKALYSGSTHTRMAPLDIDLHKCTVYGNLLESNETEVSVLDPAYPPLLCRRPLVVRPEVHAGASELFATDELLDAQLQVLQRVAQALRARWLQGESEHGQGSEVLMARNDRTISEVLPRLLESKGFDRALELLRLVNYASTHSELYKLVVMSRNEPFIRAVERLYKRRFNWTPDQPAPAEPAFDIIARRTRRLMPASIVYPTSDFTGVAAGAARAPPPALPARAPPAAAPAAAPAATATAAAAGEGDKVSVQRAEIEQLEKKASLYHRLSEMAKGKDDSKYKMYVDQHAATMELVNKARSELERLENEAAQPAPASVPQTQDIFNPPPAPAPAAAPAPASRSRAEARAAAFKIVH